MAGGFSIDDTIRTLEAIFDRHRHERVCVLSTTCTGKTTLIRRRPQWEDVDDLLGACMSAE